MKHLILLLSFCLIVGCSTFETLLDYTKSNPVFVSSALRIVTQNYISNSDNDVEKTKRSDEVLNAASKIRALIVADKNITYSIINEYINDYLASSGKSDEDKMLVKELISIAGEIIKGESDNKNPVVSVTEILDTIIETALTSRN